MVVYSRFRNKRKKWWFFTISSQLKVRIFFWSISTSACKEESGTIWLKLKSSWTSPPNLLASFFFLALFLYTQGFHISLEFCPSFLIFFSFFLGPPRVECNQSRLSLVLKRPKHTQQMIPRSEYVLVHFPRSLRELWVFLCWSNFQEVSNNSILWLFLPLW